MKLNEPTACFVAVRQCNDDLREFWMVNEVGFTHTEALLLAKRHDEQAPSFAQGNPFQRIEQVNITAKPIK